MIIHLRCPCPPRMPKTRAAQSASSIAVNGPRRNDADEGRYASAQPHRTIGPSTDKANTERRLQIGMRKGVGRVKGALACGLVGRDVIVWV